MVTRWTLCFWFCIEFLLASLLLQNVIVHYIEPNCAHHCISQDISLTCCRQILKFYCPSLAFKYVLFWSHRKLLKLSPCCCIQKPVTIIIIFQWEWLFACLWSQTWRYNHPLEGVSQPDLTVQSSVGGGQSTQHLGMDALVILIFPSPGTCELFYLPTKIFWKV